MQVAKFMTEDAYKVAQAYGGEVLEFATKLYRCNPKHFGVNRPMTEDEIEAFDALMEMAEA